MAFDFDNTLVDGDAGVLFGRHVTRRRYLDAVTQNPLKGIRDVTRLNLKTAGLVARGLTLNLRYELGHLDRHGMIEQAYRGFEGLDADEVEDAMARYAREHLPEHLREDVVEQLHHHADQGDHVVVVSTGVHDLIWPLREVLGVDIEVVACRLRRRDGTLTGTVEGPLNGAEKATRIMAIAKRRGHDLDEAWAYGDHEDDAVILEMVGNPVAVHPTRRLKQIARRKGWPMLYDE